MDLALGSSKLQQGERAQFMDGNMEQSGNQSAFLSHLYNGQDFYYPLYLDNYKLIYPLSADGES